MTKAARKMFPNVGTHKTFTDFWDAFTRRALASTRSAATEAGGDLLQEGKTTAAARASISKDPDQTTKHYPGYLRDSAFSYIQTSMGTKVEGVVGFSADYALAHHTEPKEYRYGEVQYLSRALDDIGFRGFIRHLEK